MPVLSSKDYHKVIQNMYQYRIKYEAMGVKGELVIDTLLYEQRLKKFNRLFKDVHIISMTTEVKDSMRL